MLAAVSPCSHCSWQEICCCPYLCSPAHDIFCSLLLRCSLYHWKWKWRLLSRVWLCVTPWTIQSMGFSRPEYWSREPFPSPGDLPDPGIEPGSLSLQAILYWLSYQGSLCITSFDLFDNNVFWNNFLHVSYAWDSLSFLDLWVYTFY